MPPTNETAIDPVGCLIHLPQLGLPNPAGELQRVLVAIGKQDECFRLLEKNKAADAPLRPATLATMCYNIIEVNVNGIVWLVPVSLHPSSASLPELFSIEIQRFRASSMPPGQRTQAPDNTEWCWLEREGGEVVMNLGGFTTKREKTWFARGPNESDENILKDMEEAFGLKDLSLEGLQLFRRCSDTTSAQREPPLRPETKGHLEAIQLKMKEKQTIDAAWKIWSATAQIQVRPEWKQQLQREGIAAGLFMPTMFNQEEAKARFRISPEEDGDVRGMDYSIFRNDGWPSEQHAEWRPLPEDVSNPKWVRCGVNLMRYTLGKRLFTEEDWPPRPTSLMLKQMGQKGDGK